MQVNVTEYAQCTSDLCKKKRREVSKGKRTHEGAISSVDMETIPSSNYYSFLNVLRLEYS